MSKDWQFVFYVEGLIAPEEGIFFNDKLLFRGAKDGDEETCVYFKATVEATEKEEADKEMRRKLDEAENALREMVKMYVLTTGKHAQVLTGKAASPIESDNPFGNPHNRLSVKLRAVLSPEETGNRMKRYTGLLKQTITNYNSWGFIFLNKYSYLVNALEYLCHASGD